jgi:hypothetical protein
MSQYVPIGETNRAWLWVELDNVTVTTTYNVRRNGSTSTTGQLTGKVTSGAGNGNGAAWVDHDVNGVVELNIDNACDWTLSVGGYRLTL